MADSAVTLTQRQSRELEYHRSHACENLHLLDVPLDLGLIASPKRRWWNHYWTMYSVFQNMHLVGKSVLVDGCGFGNDALSLAAMGASVWGNDLSPESVDIARRRAEKLGMTAVNFDVSPCENLPYADNFFDVIVFVDILHHVDIPRAIAEAKRVLKPGGKIVISEPYTHGVTQKLLRNNALVEKFLYPAMKRFIYGSDSPYITEDERKLDHRELADLKAQIVPDRLTYFYVIITRIIPQRFSYFGRVDKVLCQALFGAGRYVSGRFLLVGRFRQS
jgi:2-polyprenyl-3-methyl-5-hydroxy-6-metoxy-1,4-benzoquinol methylase